eukprot:365001-Chlamydomonas_euryale.AAC.2
MRTTQTVRHSAANPMTCAARCPPPGSSCHILCTRPQLCRSCGVPNDMRDKIAYACMFKTSESQRWRMPTHSHVASTAIPRPYNRTPNPSPLNPEFPCHPQPPGKKRPYTQRLATLSTRKHD